MSKWRRLGIGYIEGNLIQPSNMPKLDVEKYAERLAGVAHFTVGQDPAELIDTIGGRVEYQDIEDWAAEDGSIFVHAESDFDVLLSRYTSPLRDRFTIAHELGHYFLHSEQGEVPIIAHRKGSTRIEWEANWFAAALLMPREAFAKACQRTDDIGRIATTFGVSVDAARVRRDSVCAG